ncbi:MAG: hypothetical protein ACRDJO_05225 [Actinomycetota bacterium]
MSIEPLFTVGGEAGEQRHKAAHEAGVPGQIDNPPPSGQVLELHVCMGLNACKGHGVNGTGDLAGMGECATVQHVCHGDNNCRAQGGCGYAGSDYEQSLPGTQACKWNGSCASPINASRVSSAGPNKGKSVWQLARRLFEQRMYQAGLPFGPSPGEGYPDDIVPGYEG